MFAYDIVLLASAGLFAALTWYWLHQPSATIYHPVTFYLAFHGLIFVIRPILSRIFDYRFVYILYDFEPALWDRIMVIAGANLGLLAFVGVCWRLAPEPVTFAQDRFDQIHRDMMIKPFLVVSALLGPIALYSIIDNWMYSAADATTMVIDTETGVRVNTSGTGYFLDLQLMLSTLTVMCAWLFRFRLLALIPFGVFFLLRAGTGGRGPLIFATAMMILLFLYDRRRRWPEWRSAILAILALVMFVTVVQDRGAAVRSLFIEDETVAYDSGYEMAPMEHMDFANMEYYEYLVWAIPQRTKSFDYGASILQLFTEPIPRKWWSGKPVGPPIQFFNLFDYGNPVGMTFSLPGYGWYELGWAGIVILCGLFGAAYAGFYNVMIKRRESNFALVFSLCMVSMTVISYRDGSFVSLAKMCMFYLTPILLTYMTMRAFGYPDAQTMRMRAAGRSGAGNPAVAAPTVRDSQVQDMVAGETPAQRRKRLSAIVGAE